LSRTKRAPEARSQRSYVTVVALAAMLLLGAAAVCVSRQGHDLILVPLRNVPMQSDGAGGEPVVDAAARGAKILVRASRSLPPLPPAMVVDGTALRTGGRLLQFLLRLKGVENVIALGAAGSAAPGSSSLERLPDRLHFPS
jgi:hypothetical protein